METTPPMLTPNVTNESMFQNSGSTETQYSTVVDRDAIVGISSIVSILSITFNSVVIVTILSKRELRRSVFLWNVLALCLSDFIVGTVIVPMGISYTHKGKWIHGETLCKAWTLLEMTHFGLAATILISLNLDRLFRKILIINMRLRRKVDALLPWALCMFPWLYMVVCFIVLVLGEREFKITGVFKASICLFLLEEQYFLPSIVLILLLPMVSLITVTTLIILVHKLNMSPWTLLIENENNDDNVKVQQTSTIATWIASIVTVVTWFPHVVDVVLFMICRAPDSKCLPDLEVYLAFYIFASFSSCITPIAWFVHIGVRNRFVEIMLSLCGKCCSVQDNIQGVLALRRRRYPWDPRETELLENEEL